MFFSNFFSISSTQHFKWISMCFNCAMKMLHYILQKAYSEDHFKLAAWKIKMLYNFPRNLGSIQKNVDTETKTTIWTTYAECN